MREVSIFRAEGDEVEAVVIRIEHPMPPFPFDQPTSDFQAQARARYASEGAALAEAIWSSCPGGTVDALVVALLSRRACLLRVAFPQEKNRA